jgi:hypothetical protein
LLEALEVHEQLRRGLVAKARVLVHRLRDHRLEARGDLRLRLARRLRRLVQDRVHERRAAALPARPLAGGQLVEEDLQEAISLPKSRRVET